LALMGLGIGIGVLLHRVIPSIEIGTGIVIGLISIGLSVSYTKRIITIPYKVIDHDEEDDEDVYYGPVISSRKSRRKKK
jgi:hypothetical protein